MQNGFRRLQTAPKVHSNPGGVERGAGAATGEVSAVAELQTRLHPAVGCAGCLVKTSPVRSRVFGRFAMPRRLAGRAKSVRATRMRRLFDVER